jgi:uncharacterized protein (DUF2267 family)
MTDEYRVRGGVGPPLPGIVGPAGVDGRTEWVPVRRGADLLDVLSARLGSESEPHHVALAVLAPLAAALEGAPLGSLVAHLPPATGRELAAAADPDSGVVPATGSGDHRIEVARLVKQPPWRADATIRAVFASVREVVTGEEFEAIAARLPRDLAEVFRHAT